MTTRNVWILGGLGLAGTLLLGAYPTAQFIREREERRQAALHQMRAQILDEAVQGAINGTIPWNDSPLAMSDELREGDDEVLHEPDRALAVAAQLRYHQPDPDLVSKTFEEEQRWSTGGNGSSDDPLVDLPATWVNIGPTDARFQVNGGIYFQNDSGRATFIRTDPRFNGQGPLTLYHATATGGIWKTYDALAENPTWIPIGDTINGSTAAFDIDTSHPDTIYSATGDAFDTTQGGQILKSTAGGGDWTVVTRQLVGTYNHLPPAVGNRTETGVQVRDLRVDPNDSNRVLVATEVGLFLSADAGANFNLVQFPTFPNNQPDREANAWSIAYVGRGSDGKTHWLVSGQPACGTPQFPFPPRRGFYGQAVGTAGCEDGNRGDIWKSTDGGASWKSIRFAAGLGHYGADQHYIVELWTDVGRMTLATGSTVDPTHTVVYAWAEPNRELGPQQQPGLLAILKSVDGGETFTSVARGDTQIGYRTNGGDCPNLDVGKGQAWYNQAIAVDPLNSNNVMIGGQLCGARSRDGGRSWENTSHWLPHAGGGISGGTLKYVHADWHASLIVRVASGQTTKPVAFAGTDGGNFRATNLFDVDHPKDIDWKSNNKGITSHQFYSIASGDPVAGDGYVAFGGLQDNGTRLRDDAPDAGSTVFNQVIGGDGVASSLGRATDTSPPTDRRLFFAALPGGPREVCRTPTTSDACNAPSGAWSSFSVTPSTGDSEPFFIRYALLPRAVSTGSDQLITATTFNIHRAYYRPGQTPFMGSVRLTTWTNPTDPTNSFFIDGISQGVRNIHTSPKVYSDGTGNFRLIGATLGNGWYSVGKDRSPNDTTVDITWTNTTTRLGTGSTLSTTLSGTTSVTFPSSATNVAPGRADGDVFVVSSNAAKMRDNITPVSDATGHIFKTTNGGATWTPLHGSGAGALPNVPAEQVVFDPGDNLDRIIYALLDTGPYISRDQGQTWSRFGVGAPYSQADMMFIGSAGNLIRIGFYSRGVWEIYPNSQARGVPGDGDWDRNLQIDFLDLGALASRLGTTPATTTAPLFDWNLAMGDVNAIQESDLSALLTKFGKHP